MNLVSRRNYQLVISSEHSQLTTLMPIFEDLLEHIWKCSRLTCNFSLLTDTMSPTQKIWTLTDTWWK
ncbi:hypothetical protein KCU71_g146, partial [Aureobasidium melanogenum]